MTLSFIVKVVKPFRRQLIFLLFVSVVSAVDISFKPYLLKKALDSAMLGEQIANNTSFYFYICLYLIALITMMLIEIAYEYVWIRFFPQIKSKVGSVIFEELLEKSYTFYQNNFAGSLGNKLNSCVASIPRIIRTLNDEFFKYLLSLILSAYTLHYISLKYSLALLIWSSIYIMVAILCSPLVRKKSITTAQEASKGMGYIIDVLNNMISVKLFTSKAYEIKEVDRNFEKWEHLSRSRDLILVNLYTFQAGTFILYQVICIYWMIKIDSSLHKITPGDFVLFLSISFSIYSCLIGFSRTIADYSENLGVVSEALSTVYSLRETQTNSQFAPLPRTMGPIIFDKVRFHYQEAIPLFDNLSVKIQAGEKVGLVGYSGGGKSTFMNLILGLYDVIEGAILIEGHNVSDCTKDSLRQNIAVIPQDPSLFHRSLMENIRYGRLEATDQEVKEAAEKAHAHEFITKLPQGYDSLVGERGVKLSGGQRQRVAIARAILKNAPILILDEATSQLDSVTESLIQESLCGLMQNKTTIVIAHRLSTLLHMDRILVFEKGKMVEEGTHEELLNQGGLYRRLWEAQVGGFLGDVKKKNKKDIK